MHKKWTDRVELTKEKLATIRVGMFLENADWKMKRDPLKTLETKKSSFTVPNKSKEGPLVSSDIASYLKKWKWTDGTFALI